MANQLKVCKDWRKRVKKAVKGIAGTLMQEVNDDAQEVRKSPIEQLRWNRCSWLELK